MLTVVPITLRQAQGFVSEHHRHNAPPRGWKFGIGIESSGTLVGVVTCGRPVSREIQTREPLTVEVNRTCTDGTRNVNSMLYGAAWRAARAMGYTRAITYLQGEEAGASLRAAGWVKVKDLAPRGSWSESTADPKLKAMRDETGTGGVPRQLWEIKSCQ